MSKLQTFLDELTDSELISFYNYRYEQFMELSKDKIDSELIKRGIQKEDFDQFKVDILSNTEGRCPRCGSQKFYNSEEIETITYSIASLDLEVDYKTCLICLYSEDKENGRGPQSHVSLIGYIRALIMRKKG
ncbi:MAG TPA: hypothetical protein VKY37_00590 [Brumimicrobium sp.]|nr:hypothetical protein [Brumimicrobium sp.]